MDQDRPGLVARLETMAFDANGDEVDAEQPTGEVAASDDSFSFRLEFAAAKCPACGKAGEPGPCPHCGEEVPATEEIGELAQARISALGGLLEEALGLIASFDELAPGTVPISDDQFAHAMIEGDLFERIGAAANLGRELETLDLNDKRIIGQDLRRLLDARIVATRELLDFCRDLSIFAPAGPAAELRELAIASGRYGARITEAYIRVVTSPTIKEARANEQALDELFGGFPYADRINELTAEAARLAAPDVDSRVALVLGREGRYTDDFGFLDPGRVFLAFSEEEQPLAALADKARGYFGHIVGSEPREGSAADPLLLLPAVTLATLDRPLVAHQLVRGVHDLLADASTKAPDEAQQLIERTTAQGPLLFAAAARIRQGVLLLAAGEQSGLVDEGTVAKSVMDAYQEVAEAVFRTYGWLVRDLAALSAGESYQPESEPPTLGSLEQQLEASTSEIARKLAASSDSALRNAAGHAQYRWDSESEEIHDLRTGQRWALTELDRRFDAMVGAVIGADAGYACFLASGELEAPIPEWLAAGEAPDANQLLAEAMFGAAGFKVVEVADRGATVIIETPPEVDKPRLMTPVAGMSPIVGDVEALRVLRADGSALVDVAGEAMREALEAREDVKDLAVLGPLLSDAERAGHDPRDALMRVLAVQVAQIVLSAIEAVKAPGAGPQTAFWVAERLGYVIEFARARGSRGNRSMAKLMQRLGRTRTTAFSASRGDAGAAGQLAGQLRGLMQWAESQGVSWPPF